MKRFRWMQIEWGETRLSSLAEAMLRSEYTRDSTVGFRLEKIHNEEIVGRFIEHRQVTDELRDPFGQLMSFTRDIFDVVRFRLSKKFPELELKDPPRRFSTFVTKLAECTGFNIVVTPVEVNVQQWIEAIEHEFSATIVTAVTSSSFPLGADAVARFSIGGQTDIRQHLHHFANMSIQYWDKARLRTIVESQISEYELSSRGTVGFKRGPDENLLRTLRSKLSLAVSNE